MRGWWVLDAVQIPAVCSRFQGVGDAQSITQFCDGLDFKKLRVCAAHRLGTRLLPTKTAKEVERTRHQKEHTARTCTHAHIFGSLVDSQLSPQQH